MEGNLDDHLAGLRALLDQMRAEEAEVSSHLEGLREQIKRAARAVEALDPSAPKPEKSKRVPGKRRGSYGQYVSPRMLERVERVLVEAQEPLNAKMIGERGKVSSQSARVAVLHLRDRGRARVARRDSKYGQFYAAMPEVSDAA